MGIYSILGCYFTATASEKSEGSCWYDDAHRRAVAIADQYDCAIDVVCGVIAALSPNNRWHRNLRDAEALIQAASAGATDEDLEEIKVSTFGRNKQKAIAIIRNTVPVVTIGDILNGHKIRAFCACILDPARTDYVCVDGHAYSIWLGERVPTTRTPSISKKLYDQISRDYVAAALRIEEVTGESYSGAQVQAITWVAWRNLHATLSRNEVQS
jgi:hypothetical protein